MIHNKRGVSRYKGDGRLAISAKGRREIGSMFLGRREIHNFIREKGDNFTKFW